MRGAWGGGEVHETGLSAGPVWWVGGGGGTLLIRESQSSPSLPATKLVLMTQLLHAIT